LRPHELAYQTHQLTTVPNQRCRNASVLAGFPSLQKQKKKTPKKKHKKEPTLLSYSPEAESGTYSRFRLLLSWCLDEATTCDGCA
jgi:hypothetical protein